MLAETYCTHEDTVGEGARVIHSPDKKCSVLNIFTHLKTNIKNRLQRIVHSQEM